VRSALVIAIGGRRFAVPVSQVVEVAWNVTCTPVPCDDSASLGVALHRGRLIPVLELARRLGAKRSGPADRPGAWVFVRGTDGEVGFPVDEVVGLDASPWEQLPEGVTPIDSATLAGEYAQDPHRRP
jgi:chemotaxis signal transduction protein